MNWFVTAVASLILLGSTYEHIVYANENDFTQTIYPICLGYFLQVCLLYLIERKYKEIFID
jgi:hypothetical protein